MDGLWPKTKRKYFLSDPWAKDQQSKTFSGDDEPTSITHESIKSLIQSYPSHIPPKLQELDHLRFEEIPDKLAQRKQDGEAFLEKSEVCTLVEWKLFVHLTIQHPYIPPGKL